MGETKNKGWCTVGIEQCRLMVSTAVATCMLLPLAKR